MSIADLKKSLEKKPKLLRALVLVKRGMVRGFMACCALEPLKKQALFVNFYGKGYGDNAKAIAEEMHVSCPDWKLLFAVKPGQEASLPDHVQPVRYASPAYYRALAVSKIWVDNSRKDAAVRKRKGQFYVQTWHGGIGFKKVEADVADSLGRAYVEDAKRDAAMTDLMPVGSSFFRRIIERAFWYKGEILDCGTPRLDLLFAADAREKEARRKGQASEVRSRLGLAPDVKTVLYAPTFRSDGSTDAYRMDFPGLLRVLEERTGGSWTVLLRFHPNISALSREFAGKYGVTDVTDYPDLYELIPLADLVISDYSSLIFDAGIIEKPVLLYAKDRATYDRDLYLDLAEIPFPCASSDAELQELVKAFDEDTYRAELSAFYEKHGSREDGRASARLVRRMMERVK